MMIVHVIAAVITNRIAKVVIPNADRTLLIARDQSNAANAKPTNARMNTTIKPKTEYGADNARENHPPQSRNTAVQAVV